MVVNHLEVCYKCVVTSGVLTLTYYPQLLQVTGGGCTTLPSAITQVLNSQACHGECGNDNYAYQYCVL